MQTALVVVNPEKIYESAGPPAALVTRVLLDDRVIAQYTGILPPPEKPVEEIPAIIDGPATLRLPPGHRSVKFEFTAFDFSAPENVQFRHRLRDVEDDWVEVEGARSATHQTLNNGECHF